MQVTQPLQAAAVPPPAESRTLPPVDQRLIEEHTRARRRSIWRTLFLLVLTGLLLMGLVLWRADSLRKGAALAAVQPPVAALQERINEWGALPAVPPDADSPRRVFRHYATAPERFYATSTGGPAIIAVSGRMPLVLHPDGCCVVIYERGKLHVEWMSDRQFQQAWAAQSDRITAFEEQLRARPPELP